MLSVFQKTILLITNIDMKKETKYQKYNYNYKLYGRANPN